MKTPTIPEILQAFKVLHADSTPGEWVKGRTTHETVAGRPGQEPYRVAEFRHSADAQFCDAAHAYLPQVLQHIEQLEAQVEALKKVADGLPWYDFAGVKPLGDQIVDALNERDALLTALKETQSACDVSQCPWCGCWGPEYRDSAQPAAYCHHEFTLKPWQMFAPLRPDGLPQPEAAQPIDLAIIRQWPDGFAARLEHVRKDVAGFIPSVVLYDLHLVLAEFGFTMTVTESVKKGGA